MKIFWLVLCGLSVALLSVRMEAKPLFDIQDLTQLLDEQIAHSLSSHEREAIAELKGEVQVRPLRDLRYDTKSRRAWARLVGDKPRTMKKPSTHSCYRRKLDRIGTISTLGC
ncbi:C-type natriuretic peptide [Callorhinchus milii]|uniref:C-type natriuretic peptide 4-like protein n=1 Tax=Callorhinchus milii TaxID=7868 RepID=V9LD91_CALMI|nr:C-type natriuretic peptide [Callorhinchus milii]|eukprot:gi/632968561/ref/XP_007900593.1/ PREDICTED: C-type natriuretic peptide [Callorhinchus milii]